MTAKGEVIQLEGDLVSSAVRALFLQSPRFDAANIKVDLSGVHATDSAGLALLVHWYTLASRNNCSMVFYDCPANLTRIAELCDLEHLFLSGGEVL